ncbi:MAG: arginine deiminase family protein [Candidatus Nanopelagicales bacterium]
MTSSAYGVSSMVAPLRRVAVRTPSRTGDYAAAHWAEPVDRELLVRQHDEFVSLLIGLGAGVEVLAPQEGMPDACFTYDPVFVVPAGAIELRAAKLARVGEGERLARDLHDLGVPVVGRLEGDATADGGDMFWLDDTTLAVGRSYRTNAEAVRQLRALLEPDGITVETFDVPHDQGPEYCLHLMSLVSPVREDLAVVYERLAPVALLQALAERGIDWVCVPDDEYLSLGCNVLAVEPGVVVLAAGNDTTAALLHERGVAVHTYDASEINKGEGGPTCLTRPVLRAG